MLRYVLIVILIIPSFYCLVLISDKSFKPIFLNYAFAQSEDIKKTFGGYLPGYKAKDTTGDVLDPMLQVISLENAPIDPEKYLREFNYGRVSVNSNGTITREFTIIASDHQMKEISPGIYYNLWTFNGTSPGPTIRATEGDIVKIKFINNGSKFHTIHFHGIHQAKMDGVFEGIGPGGTYTYEFIAEPYGVFPYHCHIQPLEEHISHGLYGVYIVDPKNPREPADEMIMVMNGFDTDFDTENNFYAVNSIPYYYMHHPIQIKQDQLIRIYLVNMLEFDPINNFHLHANMYYLYRSGTLPNPDEYTDMVTMSQAERGILEFTYKFPGKYMFHAHKTEFAEKGWMGVFLVTEGDTDQFTNTNIIDQNINNSLSTNEKIQNQNLNQVNMNIGVEN
ncbi:MAG: multicopper oxidase domain-containing protein [Nitrososphaeraceae archaeon]|nr:multicopper oxidase domain-containing protein [Nitrososphaeraceae archaeon]